MKRLVFITIIAGTLLFCGLTSCVIIELTNIYTEMSLAYDPYPSGPIAFHHRDFWDGSWFIGGVSGTENGDVGSFYRFTGPDVVVHAQGNLIRIRSDNPDFYIHVTGDPVIQPFWFGLEFDYTGYPEIYNFGVTDEGAGMGEMPYPKHTIWELRDDIGHAQLSGQLLMFEIDIDPIPEPSLAILLIGLLALRCRIV